MKREGYHHRKVRGLARLFHRTGRENPFMQARAALDGLWYVTATHAPRGDVGRCTDEEIADLIGWDLDPAALIAALTELRWLDAHPTFRLLVHDWPAHADKHVHRAVLRTLEHFADGRAPRLYEGTKQERAQWLELHVPRCALCSQPRPRAPAAGYPTGAPPGTSLSLSLSQSHQVSGPAGDTAGYPGAVHDQERPLSKAEAEVLWAKHFAEAEKRRRGGAGKDRSER